MIKHTPDDFIEMKIEEKLEVLLERAREKGKGKSVGCDYNRLADLVETQQFTSLPDEKKTEAILLHMTPTNGKSPEQSGAKFHGGKGGKNSMEANWNGKASEPKGKGKGKKGKGKGKPSLADKGKGGKG